jgi:hypothetical protein
MEAKAAELLAAFKNPNLSVDSKIAYLSSVKSDINECGEPRPEDRVVLGADGEAQCFENGANCSFWNIFL